MLRTCLLTLVIALGCALAAAEPLVVYCGRKEALVGPVFERFQQETGIELDIRYNQTPALAAQLATEGEESPADVFYAQESGYLGALAKNGLLAELPVELQNQVDPRFRDDEGRWIGVTGRLRVLVIDPRQVPADQRPSSLEALSDPAWQGRIGWAPGNASFQAHVSVLRHLWGEARTRAWLEAVKANGARAYSKNSPQVKAANDGEIALGWVNHYYLHKLHEPGYHAVNHSFSAAGDAGNVLMVSGVGVVANSDHQAAAHKLVAFLVSETVQRSFATEGYEYPVRPGVPAHPQVQALDAIPLAEIDQEWLTDIGPTLKMMREVGLQ